MSGHEEERPAGPPPIQRSTTRSDGDLHNTVSRPGVVLWGQAFSRLRVTTRTNPRDSVRGYGQILQGYRLDGQTAVTPREDHEPATFGDPIFRRGQEPDEFTEVGIGDLDVTVEDITDGGSTFHDHFVTPTNGMIQGTRPLLLGKRYRVTLTLEPYWDRGIYEEPSSPPAEGDEFPGAANELVNHHLAVRDPAANNDAHFNDAAAAADIRSRYKTETVIVEFTLPRRMPRAGQRAELRFSQVNKKSSANKANPQLVEFESENDIPVFLHGPMSDAEGEHPPFIDFRGESAIVFGTFVFDIPWRSQRSTGDVFRTFEHPHAAPGARAARTSESSPEFGADRPVWTWRLAMEHLCVAACTSMALEYFGVTKTLEEMAIGAGRVFLDMLTNKDAFPEERLDGQFLGFNNDRLLVTSEVVPFEELRATPTPTPTPTGEDTRVRSLALQTTIAPGEHYGERAGDNVVRMAIWPHMKSDCLMHAAAEALGADSVTLARRDAERALEGATGDSQAVRETRSVLSWPVARWFTDATTPPPSSLEQVRSAFARLRAWRLPSRPRYEYEERAYDGWDVLRRTWTWPPRRQIVPIVDNKDAESLLPSAQASQTTRFRNVLSCGWPIMLTETLEGDGGVSHSRLCFGALFKKDGSLSEVYAHNPNHPGDIEDNKPGDRPYVSIDRMASAGWVMLGKHLQAGEILARLQHGALPGHLRRYPQRQPTIPANPAAWLQRLHQVQRDLARLDL